MKVIAIILSACMLILNTGNLLENLHSHASIEAHHMECCADHDSSCCDTEKKDQDHNKSCEDDHNCSPGCHCSCGLHFTALVYDYMEMDGITVQSFHYGNYVNTYSFEYLGDFLQPPRKA
jgi:hypothetical protein